MLFRSDWLEQHGLRGNTLVVFTSDNGMNMGHHGVYGKGNATHPMNMFDTSVKVPFLASRPGFVPQATVNDDLLSHYDVMPTLLEYVGLPCPDREALPGRSFAALLHGRRLGEVAPVLVYDGYGPVRMIRDRHWKYVHRYPYGPHGLYDLRNDREEMVNLADCPHCRAHVAALRHRLREWFLRYVEPRRDGAVEPVSGRGQIDWAGAASGGRQSFV